MAKRSLSELLDATVEAMMADARPASIDPRLDDLLRIAAELCQLPHTDFRRRLKADLQGGAAAASEGAAAGAAVATPYLLVHDASRAIDFYRQAFGAVDLMPPLTDNAGKIMHAEIKIGDSRIMLADEAPEWGNRSPQSLGGSPVIIALQVEDVDRFATQAIHAGAEVLVPVADQFYGERSGRLRDPFGHIWIVSTHQEDVSPEEMQRRANKLIEQMQQSAAEHEELFVVEPYLRVRGADQFIEFLKQAFGAEESSRHSRPDGTIVHASVRIGDSVIGTGDAEGSDSKPTATAIHLYVPDADAMYKRALRAGASSMQGPVDQPYGDREASVADPFGNHWYIATHRATAKQGGAHDAYIPEGLHSVSSYLHPIGAPRLIDFMKQAFGAVEMFQLTGPDASIVHAKIRIGESVVEMGEAHGAYQPMPTIYHLYVQDTDSVYRQALSAGGASLREPADQPWGRRSAGIQDPCGNQWWISSPLAPVAAAEATTPAGETAEPPAGIAPFLIVRDNASQTKVTVIPGLRYRDAVAAVDWLCRAFGFEKHLVVPGENNTIAHAELTFGNGMIMLGSGGSGAHHVYDTLVQPPENPDAVTTQGPYVVVADADAHYRRAVAAGARIVIDIKDQDYGGRGYTCRDPEGNVWSFGTFDPWRQQ